MKIVTLLARILLGLVFFVFGLNGFFNFIHGPLPSGDAGTFIGILIRSHYVYLVAGTQVVAGFLLLINRFIPLALALLAPVLANILVFHMTLQPSGIGVGLACTLLWLILAMRFRGYLSPLFESKAI